VCLLRTTAHFTPGLTSSEQLFSYAFRGQLLGCRTFSESGVETDISGNTEAGQIKVEHVINSSTGIEDEVTYQAPVPTGIGSCANGTTNGTALTTWPNGTFTVESYSTTGSLSAALSGNVVESMTLTAVNAKPGDPTTFTIRTEPVRR
jgi:hypothetical protein